MNLLGLLAPEPSETHGNIQSTENEQLQWPGASHLEQQSLEAPRAINKILPYPMLVTRCYPNR